MKDTLRKIGLLCWKNYKIQKRQICFTLVKVFWPVLFVMVTMSGLRPEEDKTIIHKPLPPQIFFSEAEFLDSVNDWSYQTNLTLDVKASFSHTIKQRGKRKKIIIAYCPRNNFTDAVIEEIQKQLEKDSVKSRHFQGYYHELEIEALHLDPVSTNPQLKAAIIFKEFPKSAESTNWPIDQRFSYTLRLFGFILETNETFSEGKKRAQYFNFQYTSSGFAGLQILVDKAIMTLGTRGLNSTLTEKIPKILPFPFPHNYPSEFDEDLEHLLKRNVTNAQMSIAGSCGSYQFLLPTFMLIVSCVVSGIVEEKQSGVKELIKMMGVENHVIWISWIINGIILMMPTVLMTPTILKWPLYKGHVGFLASSSWTLLAFIIFIYILASMSWLFLLSIFFRNPEMATAAGFILWFVTYYSGFLPIYINYKTKTLLDKTLSCLVPNVALNWIYSTAWSSEMELNPEDKGLQWNTLFKPISKRDDLNAAVGFFMLIFDFFLYMTLTLYFECIIPSEYGNARKWYFPFQWCYRCVKVNHKIAPDPSTSPGVSTINTLSKPSKRRKSSDSGFEQEPIGLSVGVEIKNLTKIYSNKKIAVDDVSLKIYDGQITCLLGHNGAGKTTTMSIISGFHSATSGTVTIHGCDIKKKSARKQMGLCPQHNTLYNHLTVGEHIQLFGAIKGLSLRDARLQGKELVSDLGLDSKWSVETCRLSGGQKRKVCLEMAMIGGTNVLILDEVSSGLDPEARRGLFDLLLEMKKERTIILCTHHMEEAEALADRIAIMVKGKIKCCGSSLFLRHFTNSGHSLKMEVDDEANQRVILQLVQSYFPTAKLNVNDSPSPNEISISLPINVTAPYAPMFRELHEKNETLGIKAIGISPSSLDEVFMKVGGEESSPHEEVVLPPPTVTSPSRITKDSEVQRDNNVITRVVGAPLIWQQFRGLFIKRFIFAYKRVSLFICQFLVPLGVSFLALFFCNLVLDSSERDQQAPANVTISLSDYKNPIPIIMFTSESDNFGNMYQAIVDEQLQLSNQTLRFQSYSYIKSEYESRKKKADNNEQFKGEYIVAASFESSAVTAIYSAVPSHGVPLSINLVSNTILRSLTETNWTIEIENHPFTPFNGEQLNVLLSFLLPLILTVLMPVGFGIMAATYTIFVIEERTTNAKHLQLMTGVKTSVFWGASLFWELTSSFVIVAVTIGQFWLMGVWKGSPYTNYGGAGALIVIMVLFLFSSISLSYICSRGAETSSSGFVGIAALQIGFGLAVRGFLFLISFVLRNTLSHPESISRFLTWFGRIVPCFSFSCAIYDYGRTLVRNLPCSSLTKEMLEILCDPHSRARQQNDTSKMWAFGCCSQCQEFEYGCYKPESFFKWDYVDRSLITLAEDKYPGLGQEIVWMSIVGVFYLIMFFILEYDIVTRIRRQCCRDTINKLQRPEELQDEDVIAEFNRVKSLMFQGRYGDEALVVDCLAKCFGNFAAVQGITFSIAHGECFGLLGTNGAGKTTKFKMLTGSIVPSSGEAFCLGINLSKSPRAFVHNIGYCPQFDAIFSLFTGVENLQLLGRLRGIQEHALKQEVDKWLQRFGLKDSGDIRCGRYSGGMKRRLSAAVAMIGDPPIVLLDEVSSGVDPKSRHDIVKIIMGLKKAGQSIILTSHSMDECELTCGRLAIMVNGQLQALGCVQHIKNKFAKGFTIQVKLKGVPKRKSRVHSWMSTPASSCSIVTIAVQQISESAAVSKLASATKTSEEEKINLEDIEDFKTEILECFNPCKLQDEHQNLLQYQVMSKEIAWDRIFAEMERLKEKYNIIEEYIVS